MRAEGYYRTQIGRYEVAGWGDGPWWVTAANSRTVATCESRRTALRIARLLDADADTNGRRDG